MDAKLPQTGAPVALLTAVVVERKALLRRLGGEPAGPLLWRGRWEGCPWLLTQSGIGPVAARRAIEAVLTAGPVSALVCCGLAGGLAPGAAVADVIAAERVVYAHSASEPASGGRPPPVVRAGSAAESGGLHPALAEIECRSADPALLSLARTAGVRVGTLVTSPTLVGSAADKRALHAKTGCDMVDMESAAVAAVAADRAVPFIALRAISDGPADELPAEFARLLRADGSPRWGRMTLALVRRPTLAADLWRLGRRSGAALARLGNVLAVLLEQFACRSPK